MQNRDKQIEEMAKDLCDIECKGMKCNICDSYGCEYRMQAEALYNVGYRKQSAVIDDFVERLKIKMMCTPQISREIYVQVSSLAEEISKEMKGGAE